MKNVYLVQNKNTRELLNAKGGWSRSFGSYRLALFDTSEAAVAAFPSGVECDVVASVDRPRIAPVPLRKGDSLKFFLCKGTRFLGKDDQFSQRIMDLDAGASFDTQDAALDKADTLGVHLDDIVVTSSVVRSPTTDS